MIWRQDYLVFSKTKTILLVKEIYHAVMPVTLETSQNCYPAPLYVINTLKNSHHFLCFKGITVPAEIFLHGTLLGEYETLQLHS